MDNRMLLHVYERWGLETAIHDSLERDRHNRQIWPLWGSGVYSTTTAYEEDKLSIPRWGLRLYASSERSCDDGVQDSALQAKERPLSRYSKAPQTRAVARVVMYELSPVGQKTWGEYSK